MSFARRFHLGKIGLFALLSAIDLALTWLLIRHGDGVVYESNPMASWWLEQCGWLGLSVFKLMQVVAVVGLAIVISHYRPRLGGFVLTVGCAALACVVAYSVSLGGDLERTTDAAPTPEEMATLTDRDDRLSVKLELANEYRDVLNQLSADLAEGCVSLGDATTRIGRTQRVQTEEWMGLLRGSYPGRSDEQCLAANLVTHTLAYLSDEPEVAASALDRLADEFRQAFGEDLPDNRFAPLRQWLPVQSDSDEQDGTD